MSHQLWSIPSGGSSPQVSPLPWGPVQGGQVSGISSLTFNVAPFRARDQANSVNIISTSTIPMNLATQGAGGKDYAGATLSSTAPHCVYGIWGPGVAVSAIASLSFTSPTLPVGYTNYVRIEILIPSSTSALYATQYTIGDGTVIIKALQQITLGTITAATQTAFALTSFVPNISVVPAVDVSFTPNGVNTTFYQMRNASGGAAYAVSATGSYAMFRLTLPLASTTIYGFCNAGAVAGTAYINALHFVRGAQ
jgi:hypothetical protein